MEMSLNTYLVERFIIQMTKCQSSQYLIEQAVDCPLNWYKLELRISVSLLLFYGLVHLWFLKVGST